MRIARSEPMATSKRVRKAAPLRHKFSLAVSSSKTMPRESRPRTRSGRRTAILRSDLCLDASVLTGTMGGVLDAGDRRAVNDSGAPDRAGVNVSGRPELLEAGLCSGAASEKALDAFEHFAGRFRRVNLSTKFAAVPHAMREPASELLHFANAIGLVRSFNFPVVAGE